MKGYKKKLKIIRHIRNDGTDYYTGYVKSFFSMDDWIIRYGETEPYISTSSISYEHKFESLDKCKKILRKLYLKKIKEDKLHKSKQTKTKFKVWP